MGKKRERKKFKKDYRRKKGRNTNYKLTKERTNKLNNERTNQRTKKERRTHLNICVRDKQKSFYAQTQQEKMINYN